MSYTRPRGSAHVPVSVDAVPEWKRGLSDDASQTFHTWRWVVWRRARTYAPAMAKALASSFKQGLQPFPSHFDFSGRSYVLSEPRVFRAARAADKKRVAFVSGVLSAMIADGQMDRFAVLAIGLATAGKVPHWSEHEDDARAEDAFSETDED